MKESIAALRRPTLPVAYPQLVLEIAAGRGLEPADVLVAAGLPVDLLSTASGYISPMQYTRLTVRAAELLDDPGLGMEVGLRMRPTAHGFLGYAMLSCDTLREALQVCLRFMQLRQQQVLIRLTSVAGVGVLRLQEAHPFGPVRHFFMEGLLIGIARSAQYLVDDPGLDLELWLDYPEPAYFARYRDALPRLRFGQPEIQLRIAERELDRPLRMADPVASRQAIAQCERELSRFATGDGLVADVRAALMDRLADPPRLPALAASLLLSERTLKRRLRQHGASYQQTLDALRADRAKRLLAGPRPSIEQVGAAVGFQEPASFTRAFRRWTGMSPRDYRASVAAQREASPAG